jgi:glutathione S-transferase
MNCHSYVKPRQRLEYADMAEVQAIALMLDRQVKIAQVETGAEPEEAAAIVARKFRAGLGTVLNILRCKNGAPRVKSVCFSLGSRVIRAAVADIQRREALFEASVAQQRKQLEGERARIMDLAMCANPAALARAEEGLRITREALAEMRGVA